MVASLGVGCRESKCSNPRVPLSHYCHIDISRLKIEICSTCNKICWHGAMFWSFLVTLHIENIFTHINLEVGRFVRGEVPDPSDRVVVIPVVVGDVKLLRTSGLAIRASMDLPEGLVQLKIQALQRSFHFWRSFSILIKGDLGKMGSSIALYVAQQLTRLVRG